MSATHRELQAMTARGEFRLDLFHRLCVITVELPPLRARRAEIAALVQFFLSQQEGPRDIDPSAMSCLEAYDWPGNIRELRNVLARAAALAQGPCIGADDLPDALRDSSIGERRTRAPTQTRAIPPRALREYLKRVEHGEVERALEQSGGNQGAWLRCSASPRAPSGVACGPCATRPAGALRTEGQKLSIGCSAPAAVICRGHAELVRRNS